MSRTSIVAKSLRIVLPAFAILALVVFAMLRNLAVEFGTVPLPINDQGDLASLVNPMVGTGGYIINNGATYPGATSPFGMVQLSPDTAFAPWDWRNLLLYTNAFPSGYHWLHNKVRGFSLTHMSGVGLPEGGVLRWTISHEKDPQTAFKSPLDLDHKNEQAIAGLYRINLTQPRVLVSLTTTPHAGVIQITRLEPGTTPLYIHFDSTSSISPRDRVEVHSLTSQNGSMEGELTTHGSFSKTYGGETYYFTVHFQNSDINPKVAGTYFSYEIPPHVKQGEFAIGLSTTGIRGAANNLHTEVGQLAFDAVATANRENWNAILSKIRISTTDLNLKSRFYTALYHAHLMPNQFNDADGSYLGFAPSIRSNKGLFLGNQSLWDTFRTINPLFSLIDPPLQCSIVDSLLLMKEASNAIPLWPLGRGDAKVMFGYPGVIVLAETIQKEMPCLDPHQVLRELQKFVDKELTGTLGQCAKLGYCPSTQIYSVSQTLEISWAFASLARAAKKLGKDALFKEYSSLSEMYKNLWHSQELHFLPRDLDGNWQTLQTDWLISLARQQYAEGSKNQWRFSYPQAIDHMKKNWQGTPSLLESLVTYFEDAQSRSASIVPPSSYWHGNEHTLATAFLFNDLGAPELTQKWTRWIAQKFYPHSPAGLAGNDDGGTLSAWFVFASLGFYPEAGTTRYWLTAPLVDAATITPSGGKEISLQTHGEVHKMQYIREVTINGQRLCRPWIDHSTLAAGASLEFHLSDAPLAGGGFSCGEDPSSSPTRFGTTDPQHQD